ncbi:hypothetical protein L1887_42364 [Cichorium endivia]|nr:hypothetical protein L1887_42364 [Cichorium endivia]
MLLPRLPLGPRCRLMKSDRQSSCIARASRIDVALDFNCHHAHRQAFFLALLAVLRLKLCDTSTVPSSPNPHSSNPPAPGETQKRPSQCTSASECCKAAVQRGMNSQSNPTFSIPHPHKVNSVPHIR